MKIKPQGKIIATGEDGVPWELYENGYLLFKPKFSKDTLTNPYPAPSWKEQYGESIITIGFVDKVYAPKDSRYLFCKHSQHCQDKLMNLKHIEVDKIDTSKVTNMDSMFSDSTVTTLDLSNWDTSNVENMEAMFANTIYLTELHIHNWDTSNVKNMSFMFNYTNITEIKVDNWDTSNVEKMIFMFANSHNFTMLNIGNWRISDEILANSLCLNCSSLNKITLPNKGLISCKQIFARCNNLEFVDFNKRKFDTTDTISSDFLQHNNKIKLIDCTKSQNTEDEIKTLFTNYIKNKNLDDCVILLPENQSRDRG